ncbi:VCBS domain-containing protein [Vibrio gazogenes]|uniref:VCBS domain-containing protein n=1 Tax=Vibrio gazogenes TaxID=687 RepID=UPI00208FD6D6|nr:VCBS domain-containing protein [Vibrio gazogenes]USP12595.1 VCBS domain-containing protein [Vibrio gazogenes]
MRFESKISLPDVAKDQVIIIDQDGNVITINPGEIIPPGVVILEGGNFLNHDEYTALHAKVVGPNGDKVDITDDVNQLLTSIEQGNDPTQLGETFAPAAGTTSGSSLSESATVEAVNDELIAQTDFSTQGLYRFSSLSISTTQGLALLDVFNTLTSTSTNTPDSASDALTGGTADGTNNAPVAQAATGSVTEDATITGSITATDVDLPAGQSLVFTTGSTVPGLTLNPDGTYRFDASSYDQLSEGETQVIEVPVTVLDERGATDTTTLTITVTGTNDAPVAQAAANAVTEDATITGSITATDVDLPAGQSLVFITDATVPGLTLNPDGTYRFDASSYDQLSEGETQVIEVPVTVLDERGATDTTTLTITVTGTNDAPVAQAATDSVSEDATITGSITATDVDLPAGQSLVFITDATVPGLTLNPDGTYRFDASSYDQLSEGETQVIEVPVTVLDERGATDTTTLTITVTGTNDAPVAQAATDSVSEDATITGSITATDVDLPAGQSLVFITDATVPGLTLNPDGTYRFDASSYDHLSEGETQVIEVPITVLDERGATDTTTLTITVTGTNDAPVAQAATDSVSEDATITGSITATDVDLPDNASLTFSTESTVAGLTLNTDGSYSFDASGYDALGAGETQEIEVPVTVTDDRGATVTTTLTITVTGTDDAPVVTGTVSGSVTEGDIGDVAQVSGTIAITDADAGDTPVFADTTVSGTYGSLTLVDGQWTYTLNQQQAQSLAQDETVTDTITLTASDGTTQDIKITITGTNDAPVAEAVTRSVSEDTTITGSITASDVDLPDDAGLTFSTESTVSGLTLNTDGSYSFDASGYDALSAGETQVIKVPVTVTDDQGAETTTTLTITVTGTDDAPVVTGTVSGSVTEGDIGDVAQVSGSLAITDADAGDTPVFADTTVSGTYGSLTLVDGQWTYTLNQQQVQSLAQDETVTDTITLTASDGTTQDIKITITGTNDAPVAETVTRSVSEDATITGSVTASDVDLPDDASLTFSTESTVSGLTLNADGSYSFDASGYDALGVGETQEFEVPVTVTDDRGATVTTTLTITITGTNDAPEAQTAVGIVAEDATITGSVTATDVDLPDGQDLVFTTESNVAGLTLNADGSYSFDASGYDALGVGEKQVIEVPITVTDDRGATAETTLTITVVGTNDAPVAEAVTRSVSEDATITGNITASDVDLPDDASLTFSTESTVSGLTLNADGSYSFDASGYDALGVGETQEFEVPVTVTDDRGATVTTTLTITITGTNDAPEAQTAVGIVAEDATITGSVTATDVDLPDGQDLVFTTESNVAGLTLNADGSYSFDASGYDALGVGEKQVIEVPITVTDDRGATAETTLTITVVGTNDAPVAEAVTRSVSEDATITGNITASDVDLPDDASLTYSTGSTVSGLTLNADGSYSFDASGYDALGVGETQEFEVPVTVTDDRGATVTTTLTITITGTNDAPEAQAAVGIVAEDATITGSVTATDVDLPDGQDLVFTTESNVAGLTLNADGTYSFDASSYDALAAGEKQVIEVPITVTDDRGATAETTLTITVVGTNDAPVAEAVTRSVSEDATITGNITATDVDLPDDASLTYSTESTVSGLTLNADGTYSFDASGYDALAVGEKQVIEVPVTVTDDRGATAETTLTITVVGTNDAPVAEAVTRSVSEDATITGNISATDVDLPDDASLTYSTESNVLGLTLNADGSYSFDASGYDALAVGEKQVIEVPVTVTDDRGATAETTLTITITGTNDAPEAQAAVGIVAEDATITGSVTATDVDLPDGQDLVFTTESNVAGLTLNADGTYSFDASSYDALAAGEKQVIEVPITVTDDRGATAETTLTITVVGTNDAPVAEAVTRSVSEDATITGNITATDVDLPDDASLTYSTESTVSGLTLNADGTYSFDASGYDALAVGEKQVIEVPVTVTDDRGATAETTLTITVVGTNDAPVAEAVTRSVSEDATITGNITATDVDLPDDASLTYSTESNVLGLTLNADGSYSFDASGYDALAVGEKQVIEVPVTVTDDRGATAETTLTITITGTNDAPVAEAVTRSVSEDATITGNITATDVDLPDDASLTYSTESTVSGLTLNTDGTYSFDASGYDALAVGEKQVIEVPVTVTDDRGATAETTLTITVVGTNDAPVAEAVTRSVSEDATITGSVTATDVDLPDGQDLVFTTESNVAGLTLNTDGTYSFDASGYDALAVGEKQVIEVPVTVTDDRGATAETTLTITVVGTNDAPVAEAVTRSVSEDATITGNITATDVDLPDDASLTFSTESTVSGLTFNADGSYSFDASGYDALGAGETQEIEVPVTVTDDRGATVTTTLTITVTGTNDAPVVEAVTRSVSEDATITGNITATDVDLPDDASLTYSTESTVSGLTFNADGSYSFDASGYDALGAGETQEIEVPVTVTDDRGATVTTTLTITVTGTNDAPVAEAVTRSVSEDATITGNITATDVDLPDDASLTYSTESTVSGLTLNADGSYSFDASGYDALGAGETQEIEVPVTVTDDRGATVTTTLTITVTGTNDAPVAEAVTRSVSEDATITGNITATDVDLPDDASLTYSTESTVSGLTLNADGSYSFDASGYDALAVGEKQVIEVPVTVTDDRGATAETTLTITVVGTNDAPVAEAVTRSVSEDATITGNITATDVDLPDDASLTYSTESTVSGLTLNADGSYSFDASGYDALGAGEEQVIEVPITVTDDRGATAETTLTITVVGTNDAPEAQAAVGIVAEDATITGSVTATDVDLPDGQDLVFTTESNVAGLTLNADGSYSFDASGYDALAAGEKQVIEVPVTVTDDRGATAETTLTITVVGTNDAPEAQAAVGIVAEDATITGSVTATDVDLPDGQDLVFTTESNVAGLTLNADGSYSFDASGYDALAAGEKQVIEVPVTVTDDRGATAETTLTITVVGTNDAPEAQAAVGIVAEDATITGNITATDVDLPDDASLTYSTESTVSGLTLNADGSYSFDASGYDALAAGEKQVIEVPVTVTDDRGATVETTLTITVVGTNDAPVAEAVTRSVSEDATITGNITASDVDLPDDASLTFSTESTVSGLTFNADGTYSFDASGYDALGVGETQEIEVPVTVTDDRGATVTTTLTITVTGTNDAPEAEAVTRSVSEDATITGNITATDVDLPDDASLTYSTESTVSGLTLNADGSYSFDASGYDALGAGETQEIEVPVTVTDDRGATVTTTLTITVTGTNDAPVAEAVTRSVSEDATISGSITASDVDLPDDASLTFSTESTVSGLTFNADGSYSFDASGYDALGAGETQEIEVPVTVTDDRGATVTTTLTITVTGTNDAPVVEAVTRSVSEDATITGNITATDVDLPDDASLTFSTESTVSGLTFNADGSYSFDASGYDALGAGETQEIEVPVTVTDDRGATVTTTLTITVTGTNDAPVVEAVTRSVSEDATITGNITATDVDLPNDASLTFSAESTVSGLTFNADGSYSFDASGYDALGAGETQEIEVPVTVTDDRGATVTTTLTITVTGTNDAPVAEAVTRSVSEDATITGNITATDVDLPDDASLTYSTESTVSGLTLNADGSYSFAASGYDALAVGEKQVIEVPVTVTDDRGATAETTLTITVVGTNDAPVAEAVTRSVSEDATITGNITATDVDLPDDASLTYSTESTVSGLTLNADGSYSFDASGYDALGAGEEQVIEVPITVTDDRGATAETTLTITVVGTNDAPEAQAAVGIVAEDATITGSVTATDVDLPDGQDLVFTTESNVAGLTLNADGSYSFDASSYDALAAGEKQVIEVPITVTDDRGATAETTLTITVVGTNDAPEAQTAVGIVAEDATITGSVTATDVDLPDGQDLVFTTESNVAGLTLNADGSYSFDASGYDALAAGEKQVIEVPVTVTDDRGATAETTLTITVVGTNDAPEAQAAVGIVAEDATITGSITATDVDLPDGQDLVFTTESNVAGLTLNADGSYSFDASGYDALAAGEKQVIEVPITVTDDRGATAETTLTITVVGTNDAPEAQTAVGIVAEDATITGSVTATDVDLPDGQDLVFTTESNVAGLTLNADGSYSFDASGYDALAAGEKQVIEVPVTVTDDRGATAETTLTITVVGTNDAPEAQAAVGIVAEDATITGSVTATDVDLPDGQDLVFTTESNVAGLTLNADGSYSFDASGYDALAAGEKQVIEVPVTVTDDRGATAETTLTITVVGTNDAPEAQAAVGIVAEDATITGSITATDVDLPDGQDLVFTTESNVAGLTLNADGSYSFDASGYDALAAGEKQVIEVPVTVTDDRGATVETTLTITVVGTNDAPVAEAVTRSVSEDATITGNITASDVDLPDDASLTFSTESTVSGLTFNADGTYSFDASGYDALGVGETQEIEVPVTVTDDRGATVTTTLTITVTGTNDAPEAEAVTRSVSEDATITGNITATDVDLPDDASLTYSTESTVSGLTLNADGSYSFDASGYDALGAGETQEIEVPVTVTDDRGATVTTTLTITVTGTNDAPVVEAVTRSVSEDATITGNITATDVDLPDDASLTYSTESTVSGLTFNADGSYSFDASGYDHLSEGETQVIKVPVTVTDDQGAETTTTLTITVTGTDDAPVVTGSFSGSVTEGDIGDVAQVSGSLAITDADAGDTPVFADTTVSGTYGSLTLVDGQWTYTLNQQQVQSLAQDETVTDTITLTASDGTTQDIKITITGTNDAPVAEAVTRSVSEDTTISGNITASDVDLPDDASLTYSTESTVSGLTFNADGSYSFDASGYDALGAGETQEIEVPVTVTDDRGATVTTTLTITVTGTNDAPVVEAVTRSVSEDATITGNITATDVDLPDDASLTYSTESTVAGLTFNADGSYSFDASGYDALGAGEKQVIEVPITVTDDRGATAETTLTITVVGTNDAPVVEAVTRSVSEDATITGNITATDVDLPDDASLTYSTESNVLGLTLNADGSYSFDASGYDALAVGEKQVIEVPVTVTDDRGATAETTLTITVVGTNDAPEAQTAVGIVAEDATITGSVTATDVDLPDGQDLVFTTESNVAGLTLNTDGTYSFDASGYDVLAAGDKQVIEVPVTVTDDRGATAETTLTITVVGTNDAPVAEAVTRSVSEDATITGSVTATDVDLPDGQDLVFTTESNVAGLTLNTDGTYSFDASGYDALAVGEKQVIEVPITVTDDRGATAETTLTITVVGTNDAPVAEAVTRSVSEDATITGNITASDVDLPDDASLTYSTESTVSGLTLNVDGSYSFDASGYDALAAGEKQVIEVPVTVTDDRGATAETTLTITVVGTNDAPVAEAVTRSVSEDATITGNITATDVDLPNDASLTYSTESTVSGLTFNADGSYSFDASGYDHLSEGETQVIKVPVTVTDDQGAETTTTLTITVTGTDDAPVVTGSFSGSVTEGDIGDVAQVSGSLAITDADAGDTPVFADTTVSGTYGSLTLVDGQWTYTLNQQQVQSLAQDETVTDTITLTASDGTTQDIKITITGTNDAPVAEAVTRSVSEDTTISGNITASDVDLPDDASLTYSTESTVSGLTFNADGSYSFDASGYDALGAGETQEIEVPVTVTDDRGATVTTTLTITITGTNDAPVVEAVTRSVSEDTTISGNITASDVDLPDDASLTYSTESTVAGLTFNADGSYSFDASGYDALGAGEKQVIEVPITVTDDRGATAETTLTITVVGTNDAPVVEAVTRSVSEDATITGNITATDVDLPDDASLTYSAESTVSGLTLNTDGSYSFDASGYDALAAGEKQVIEVPITVTDDRGATAETTLTITVVGTNDAPVAEAVTRSVSEDATITGNITATDVDLPDDASLTYSTESTVSGLTLNADGSYSFDASGYDALGVGETQEFEVPVTVTDDRGATVTTTLTITITGTNDAPVAEAVTRSVSEDATITGNITATDVDLPDDASLTYSTESTVSGLTLNADGSYSFDASGYDALAVGEKQVIEVPVTVTDDRGATAETTLTITVVGTNDAPVAEAVTRSVSEDATITGSVTATDVDLPDGQDLVFTTESNVVGLTLNADGSYSFDASGYDALAVGEKQVIEVPVTVTDDRGATAETTLTITVVGTNDAPVAEAVTRSVSEDATITGNIAATDVDLPDDASLTYSTESNVLGLTLNADGSYSFAASGYDALAVGEKQVIEVPVTVTDDRGATAETTLTITVVGTNDAPVAEAVTRSVSEDATITGSITASDVDLPDDASLTYSTESTVSGLTFNADGSYSFDASGYDALGAGEKQVIEVPITVTDDRGATAETTLTITVVGTNDAPVAEAVTRSVSEDATISGSITASDVDLPDDASLTYSTESNVLGLTLNADGSYSFDASGYDHLSEGETQVIKVPVTVTDDQGAETTTTLTITVTGTDDAPVVTGSFSGSVTEGDIGDVAQVSGSLAITDADAGDTPVFADTTVSGTYGSVTLVDGQWTYTLNQQQVQSLAQDEIVTDTITLTASDGTTQDIKITITGTNDAPVAEAVTRSVSEDTTISGNITASDVDLPDDASLTYSTESTVSGLTFNANGSYSFDASSYDHLSEGETQVIKVPVTVTDDQGAETATTLTITVIGTNDAPQAHTAMGIVAEDNAITGHIIATDVDLPDDASLTFSTESNVAGLTLNADGTYSFDASSYDALAAGEIQIIKVPITVTDDLGATGTTTLTIRVVGTNDAPLVEAVTDSVTEDATITGSITATDVDLPADASLTYSTESNVLGLTLNADGTYRFDASGYDALEEGETQVIEVPVTVTDDLGAETGTTLTITVTGTNDAPVVDTTAGIVAEDNAITGRIIATDVDLPDDASLTFSTESNVAGLTLNADGTYSFDASSYDALTAGEIQIIEVPVTVTDDLGATGTTTLTIRVVGTNDAPVAEAVTDSVTEDATITGSITATDVDLPDDASLTYSTESYVPGLTLNADGTYSFDASDYDALAEGETQVIQVPVTVTDDHDATVTTTLTITVTGTDDAPVVTGTFSGSVTEGDIGDVAQVSGTIAITDADASDNPTFADTTVSGTYGSLTLVNGQWTYTLDQSKAQSLADGEQVTDTITLTASDGTAKQIEIDITGTNNAPVIALDDSAKQVSISEEGLNQGNPDTTGSRDTTNARQASGSFSVSDPDSSSVTLSLVAPTTALYSHGIAIIWTLLEDGSLIGQANGETVMTISLSDEGDGDYSYTVNMQGPVDHPDSSGEDSLQVDFGISADDGQTVSTQSIQVSIEDDSPDSHTTDVVVETDGAPFDFSVSGTTVSLGNSVFDNGCWHTQQTDSSITWGTSGPGDSSYSSYQVSSQQGSHHYTEGQPFELATLVHHNGSVLSNESTLDSTVLTVVTQVTVNGVTQSITIHLNVDHDETSNNTNTDGDSITLTTDYVDVEIDGVMYRLDIEGFKNDDGTISKSVVTAEGETETYTLVASLNTPPDSHPDQMVTGTVDYDAGADGMASVVWQSGTENNGDTVIHGEYGTLTVYADGHYTYDVNEDALAALDEGTTATDSFNYVVTDNDGDSATSSLNFEVSGNSAAPLSSGLHGEFYNYQEDWSNHWNNVDSLADALGIIQNQDPNAEFTSTQVNYQSDLFAHDLGGYDASYWLNGRTNLEEWLEDTGDDSSVVFNNKENSSDAVVRLTGGVALDSGTYSMKVTADDGYQVKINGVVVAAYDGIQSATTDTFTFTVDGSGYQTVEIIYWDQGEAHQLTVSLADVTDGVTGDYSVLGSDAYPTVNGDVTAAGSVDVITDHEAMAAGYEDRIDQFAADHYWQTDGDNHSNHLVGSPDNDHIDGHNGDDWIDGGLGGTDWLNGGNGDDTLISSYGGDGDLLEGERGDDYLYGRDGDDILIGGQGDDYLSGSVGDDILIGGMGDDYLSGGAGNDILIGGSQDDAHGDGSDVMIGGAGEDLFVLDSSSVDEIQDFQSSEDAIDLSNLLADALDNQDNDAIQQYLDQHVEVTTEHGQTHLSINDVNVADFGYDSSFNASSTIAVIINDHEFSVKYHG